MKGHHGWFTIASAVGQWQPYRLFTVATTVLAIAKAIFCGKIYSGQGI